MQSVTKQLALHYLNAAVLVTDRLQARDTNTGRTYLIIQAASVSTEAREPKPGNLPTAEHGSEGVPLAGLVLLCSMLMSGGIFTAKIIHFILN